MGHIRESHGKITIESRKESFYVHTGYGYEPERRRLGWLPLGSTFVKDVGDREYQVVGQYIGKTFVKPTKQTMSGLGHEWSPELDVIWTEEGRPNTEKNAEGTFAALWRDLHPEFLYDDLDDFIAALESLRESRADKKAAA